MKPNLGINAPTVSISTPCLVANVIMYIAVVIWHVKRGRKMDKEDWVFFGLMGLCVLALITVAICAAVSGSHTTVIIVN